jgi:hypothetical protein
MEDSNMKVRIGLAAAVLLATGFVTATPEPASAVIYCSYVGYPAGCIARPGVVLRARPVAGVGVGARGVGVRAGTPMNRGGPVNRVGRRWSDTAVLTTPLRRVDGDEMADQTVLRALGLVLGSVTALVALAAFATVMRNMGAL